MFKRTIYQRVGDNEHVVSYMRNLLDRMKEGARRFSVFSFIWEEIHEYSCSPQKSLGLAPYIMGMIENVTGMTFQKDGFHRPLKLTPSKKPIVIEPEPPAGAAAPTAVDTSVGTAGASTSVGTMGATTSQFQPQFVWGSPEFSYARERDSSLLTVLKSIFCMCKRTDERTHKERQARKKTTEMVRKNRRNIKEMRRLVGQEVSPDGSELQSEAESSPQHIIDFETLLAFSSGTCDRSGAVWTLYSVHSLSVLRISVCSASVHRISAGTDGHSVWYSFWTAADFSAVISGLC